LLLSALGCAPPVLSSGALGPPAATPTAATQAVSSSRTGALALPNTSGSVKFLVIGDTGTGGRAQYQVAERIVESRARFPFDFAIMLGDNLYGAQNPSDFVQKFERPYKPLLDVGVRFYASLGNHDEPGQRFYEPFNMGGERYYNFRKSDVEFFALDTTYLSPAQVDWLKRGLEQSRAPWKIAYMHHPIYSSGERHGSELDMRAILEPLFQKNGVDVVFAGHEHFYERLMPQQGIHYFTQGGSAKLRPGNIRNNSPMTAKGFDTDNSFTLVEIVDDTMFFETISRAGRIVDSGTVRRREAPPPPS